MRIFGASWNGVKLRCKCDVQRDAAKQSRDLIATANKAQLTRCNYPNQNQIERQWEHVKTSKTNIQPCIVTISRNLDLKVFKTCLIINTI